MSRRSYGSPRVHAELRLGQDVRCSRKRVERLMRQAGISGIHRRRRRGCTKRDLAAQPSDDLVKRSFDPAEPDRLWVMDVTEHPTDDGKAYLAVVLDAFSRRVVGWSIADHMRLRARRRCPSDWLFGAAGHPLVRRSPTQTTGRPTRRGPSDGACAGPACSVPWDRSATALITPWPRASSAPSNSSCSTSIIGRAGHQLAQAIFEWIEAWYNPKRRHSYCKMLSPVDYEAVHAA